MDTNLDLRGFPELVRDMLDDPRRHEQESTLGAVVHLATYDLDYFGYILVQTWDLVESKLGNSEVRWEYSLWYGHSNPIKIYDFANYEGDIPFVESAVAVKAHIQYVYEYTAEHNDLP